MILRKKPDDQTTMHVCYARKPPTDSMGKRYVSVWLVNQISLIENVCACTLVK